MDVSRLIEITNPTDIMVIIERGSLFGGDVWQNQIIETDNRERSQVIKIQVEPDAGMIYFQTPTPIQLNLALPIYIRLNYRNLIFRMMPGEFKVLGDRVYCQYPHHARAFEERPGERYVLPVEANLSLSLKRLEKTMREMTFEMELRIIDVSERGFGIIISGHNRDYFKKHDSFWLKAVDHRSLSSEILGTVRYVAPKSYLKKGNVRVGLFLQSPLPFDTFENLKRKCHIVLSA